MTGAVPLATVHEEAQLVRDSLEHIRACIIGPLAHVVEAAFAGSYDVSELVCPYPDLPEGARVDSDSVKVVLDAQLCYYIEESFRPVPDYPDRIIGPDVLCSSPGQQRSPRLKSRDVQIGDLIGIRDGETAFWTKVIGFLADDAQAVRTILLQRNLPAALRERETLHVSLGIARTIELAPDRYIINETSVTLPAELDALDSQWFDRGQPAPLQISSATVKLSYRAWLTNYADKVYTADFDFVNKIFGEVGPENPLGYGVTLAIRNSGGLPVDFIAIPDPANLSDWNAALFKAKKAYGIVALSDNPEVQALVRKFVRVRSQAEAGRECVTWQPLRVPPVAEICTVDVLTRTIRGGGFMVEAEDGQFITKGVRNGDLVELVDTDGVVEAVLNEDTLVLAVRGTVAESAMLVIRRNLSLPDYAHAIGKVAASVGDKRVRMVWPDSFSDGKHRTVPGYQLCAALAGLRSGAAVQQDLTGVELAGVADVPRTVGLFEETELDMMAELGVWIVTEIDGKVVTRKGLTTADPQKPEESNESVVTNLDHINKTLRAHLAELLATVRATTAVQAIVRSALRSKLREMSMPLIARIGPQILESDVVSLRRHVILEESLVLSLQLLLPMSVGYGPNLGRLAVQQKIVA